ncbi:MAG: TIGR04053 family radical SAM/SPASM domain-containing protein [Candidatus Methanodesulfokora sp.]|jgi:radical SAM protein
MPLYDERPVLVLWETTKACPLSCKHCRAEADMNPAPDELSTAEGMKLMEELSSLNPPPALILSGGDPMMRKDIFELIDNAVEMGIPVGIAPANTEKVLERADELSKVRSISISLDGITMHDKIRGEGNFELTLRILRKLKDRVQVNTLVARENVKEIPYVLDLLLHIGIKTWELFFLIKTGRGVEMDDLSPWECEDVLLFLYEASSEINIRTVEAPFIRRIALQGALTRGDLYRELSSVHMPRGEPKFKITDTRDGKGIIFVSHNGYVFPSGFLPLPLGNVRKEGLLNVYRENTLLKSIRRAEFSGRCGICEFRDICGGSRSRAYAYTGDPLASDPACLYTPR